MKKNVTVTCKDSMCAEHIYSLLTNPVSGDGELRGEKLCTHDHELTLPDTMEFELTDKEIEDLSKHSDVLSIIENDTTVKFNYTKTEQKGLPRLASFNPNFNCMPHSMFYGQNYKLLYTHSSPTNGQQVVSLSSIDCSNIDILVLDSGLDTTHPEISGNVVNFNWSLLKEGDPITGDYIVSSVPNNYNEDTDGHGTACASLVAGRRCGFAKSAKLYSLRSNELGNTTNGYSIFNCMRLALAFQKAKALNLHGLNSSRPTIFTNSWGYLGPYVSDDFNYQDKNTINLYTSIDEGKNTYWWNSLPGINSVADGYIRACLAENMHVLVAAGNENIYCSNNPSLSCHVHLFNRDVEGTSYLFSILRTEENNSAYSINSIYNEHFSYVGVSTRHFYSSPNIGLNFSKDSYPVISVGDISPIGENDSDQNIYRTGGNSKAAYTVLSGLNNSESRILKSENVRYTTDSGPFFIKSSYSNFGPDVDIYATGNGCWAAASNQAVYTTGPKTTANVSNLVSTYRFFNGTSAACPIVAGVLATYLSENPTATPAQARQWLINNSVKGNIMETQSTTLPISSYDGYTTYTVDVPFGCNLQDLSDNSSYRLSRNSSQLSLYRQANIEDVLFCCRFFNSNNRVAYAFPTRRAVVRADQPTINLNGTELTKNVVVSQAPTHSYNQ